MPATLTTVIVAILVFARAASAVPATGLEETTVAFGFTRPTAMAFLPDGRFLVAQRDGAVLVTSATQAPALIGTVPVCLVEFVDLEAENGILGIAVHPDFPANRSIYVYRTHQDTGATCDFGDGGRRNQLIRVELGADDRIDLGTVQILRDFDAPESGLNGGGLRIGPDRKLYLSIADGYLGILDAQDPTSLDGKILRLELDGAPSPDNPFANGGGRPEIFAVGFNNPFRFSFDPVSGALWAGDVGALSDGFADGREEIDIVTAGGNYAWPRCQGTVPAGCHQPGDTPPVLDYPHLDVGSLGLTAVSGAFPQGGALEGFSDRYVFADLRDGSPDGVLYSVTLTSDRRGVTGTPQLFAFSASGPIDLAIGPDGALYYVSHFGGVVRRVAATRGPGPRPAPVAACASIPECQTALDGTLPDPASAGDKRARAVARRLHNLDRSVDVQLAKAAVATGKKRDKRYRKVRTLLGKLIKLARKAESRGRLGVPLGSLDGAVAALLATIPA